VQGFDTDCFDPVRLSPATPSVCTIRVDRLGTNLFDPFDSSI